MKKVIEAQNISKSFSTGGSESREIRTTIRQIASGKWKKNTKTFWALKDVSFDVFQGECFGILGQNGAGKSTLLKILARITPPTSGRIILDSYVSCLLQTGAGFNAELTGRENIMLGGVILGMSSIEVKANMDAIIDFSELEDFIDTPLKYYSSGMKARLGFSSSVFLKSDIIILDEVLSTGDMNFKKKSLDRMTDIIQGGTTVIFVSHSLGEINRLCSRAMYLENGQVQSIGETEDIIKLYTNPFEEKKSDNYASNVEASFSSVIKDVRIDQVGKKKNKYIKGSPLEIIISLHIVEPTEKLDIQINLFEGTGNNVLFTNYYADNMHESLLETGQYNISAIIPADTLVKGKYTLKIGHADPETLIMHEADMITEKLDIADVGLYDRPVIKKFGGRVTIPLIWKASKID